MISFFNMYLYDILSLFLKIALTMRVLDYDNWFSSHVKYSSSLRSSP